MKFEAGKTYFTRSICDYNCIFKITVAKRTAKTIKTTEGKTLRISEYEGVEQVKPFGTYSMCAVIGADSEWIEKPKAEAKAEEPQTLAELMAEGAKLFTPEQLNEIKAIVKDCLPELDPKNVVKAKVYNLADYRKKA